MKQLRICTAVLTATLMVMAPSTHAQTQGTAQATPSGTSAAVQAKLMVRGELTDVAVPEIRIARRGGFLSVQSDLSNRGDKDRALFYRYRWLDGSGGQVGDGDAWKQLRLMGKSQETLKGTAPMASVTDFRLELSFEDQ